MGQHDRHRGLYDKYQVRRTDGSDDPGGRHHGCRYFVLDLNHDPHAIPAIAVYSESCRQDYPALARDLEQVIAGQERQEEEMSDLGREMVEGLREALSFFRGETPQTVRCYPPGGGEPVEFYGTIDEIDHALAETDARQRQMAMNEVVTIGAVGFLIGLCVAVALRR